MGKPLALASTGTMGSHTQKLGDNRTMPHDYLDMNLPHTGATAWTQYNGRIGSLARQRRPAKEVDQDRYAAARALLASVSLSLCKHLRSASRAPSWTGVYRVLAFCVLQVVSHSSCNGRVCDRAGPPKVGDLAARLCEQPSVHDGPSVTVCYRRALRTRVSGPGRRRITFDQLVIWEGAGEAGSGKSSDRLAQTGSQGRSTIAGAACMNVAHSVQITIIGCTEGIYLPSASE